MATYTTQEVKSDQMPWWNAWGQLKKAAADLDAAVQSLESQRGYALARPELAAQWQAKRSEIESARGRVTWLRDTIRSVMSYFGTELQGLGFLPLIPIALVTAGVAYVANIAASAWELSRKIGEQQRLEQGGLTPAQASVIVRGNAAAGPAGTADTIKTMAIVGGLAFFAFYVLPKLLPRRN
jgi:hypothetical protein